MSIRTSFAYLCVSGGCFFGHNIVMIVADSLHTALWLAVLLSFAAAVTIGYISHSLFTFKRPLSISVFIRYAIGMSLNIPLAFATTWFWYSWLEFSMPVAAPLASLCMLALNFLLSRWAISKPDQKKAVTS